VSTCGGRQAKKVSKVGFIAPRYPAAYRPMGIGGQLGAATTFLKLIKVARGETVWWRVSISWCIIFCYSLSASTFALWPQNLCRAERDGAAPRTRKCVQPCSTPRLRTRAALGGPPRLSTTSRMRSCATVSISSISTTRGLPLQGRNNAIIDILTVRIQPSMPSRPPLGKKTTPGTQSHAAS
jgi:hypothetical protein